MLLFLCFLLWIFIIKNLSNSFLTSILKASLWFGFSVILITEILSLFNSINRLSIVLVWILMSSVLFFVLFKQKQNTLQNLELVKTQLKTFWHNQDKFQKSLTGFILFALMLMLFQGIIYPPNNWDSMTYHMTRIVYWISNENVNHFQTTTLRNLYQPPFSEFFILNQNLINGNDYFSNAVQWFYLVLSCCVVWQILVYFKVSKTNKLLALLLLITIPSLQQQASTTKNDIICGYFVLVAFFFVLEIIKNKKRINFIYLGLTVGQAMMTKGTSYIFLLPVGVFLAIHLIKYFFNTKKLDFILPSTLTLAIILGLNSFFFYQNYKLSGNILKIDKKESDEYFNSEMNIKHFVSCATKNVGLHIGMPFQSLYEKFIYKLHSELGIDINDEEMNYNDTKYNSPYLKDTHEDSIPNSIQIQMLFVLSIILLYLCAKNWRKNKPYFAVFSIIALQVFLFIWLIKWQPWHTRLHIPIFMFSVFIFAFVFEIRPKSRKIFYIILPFILYSFGFNYLHNASRPILKARYTRDISIKDNRFKKRFANQIDAYPDYASIHNLMIEKAPKKIGICIGSDSWTYPLFYNSFAEPQKIIAINVDNISNKIKQDESGVDFLILITNNSEEIFENKKYKNITPKNTKTWAYELIK